LPQLASGATALAKLRNKDRLRKQNCRNWAAAKAAGCKTLQEYAALLKSQSTQA